MPRSARLDELLQQVLDEVGAVDDRELLASLLATAAGLAGDHADTLDLKITAVALREMRRAFRVFAPYRDVRKVTIFGSARTTPDDPLYAQARSLAKAVAARGWMVVTGAGPGIMAAGMEGAGRDASIGVTIRLPSEQGANPFIAGDDKLAQMKYFFTRKLMLVKESSGFVSLPGGFGTLDETFELLTLTQTGKGAPVPIVFLDVPGGTYWEGARRFISTELAGRGLISERDLELFTITDDVGVACSTVVDFYENYQSLRYLGDRLVVRLRRAPGPAALRDLDERFADVLASGHFEVVEPFPAEVRDGDALEDQRVAFHFRPIHAARLLELLRALNAAA
jgi:uncharacterized protein (TIGR00730 family)